MLKSSLREKLPVLPRSRAYRQLVGAANISEFGDWSARLTLAALIYAKTNDAAWVGMVSVVFVAPSLGLGQVLTGWFERFNRKVVLVLGDALRTVLFLFMAVADLRAGVVLVVVFVAATVDPVFGANASAATYDTLTDDDRDDGVRFRQVSKLVSQLAGLGAAGIALRWWSPESLLFANAVSFAASALVISRTSIPRAISAGAASLRQTLVEAFGVVVRQPDIRSAMLTTSITIFAATALEAQVIVLAQGQPAWVLPVASGLVPLGAVVAIAMASTEGQTKLVLRRTLRTTTISAAVAIAALALNHPWAVVVAFACSGVMFQTTGVGQVVAVRHLPIAGRASILSLLQTVVLVGSAAGAAASGFAMNAFGNTRGMQLCIVTVILAWLVRLPSAESTQTSSIKELAT